QLLHHPPRAGIGRESYSVSRPPSRELLTRRSLGDIGRDGSEPCCELCDRRRAVLPAAAVRRQSAGAFHSRSSDGWPKISVRDQGRIARAPANKRPLPGERPPTSRRETRRVGPTSRKPALASRGTAKSALHEPVAS